MKTIEEKCDELFVNCSDDMSKYKSKELAVNLAEFTQRWIPVEEELPEMSDNDEDWIFDMYDEDDEDDDYDDEPIKCSVDVLITDNYGYVRYRDWETDRKSTRLNSSHSAKSRMPSSA